MAWAQIDAPTIDAFLASRPRASARSYNHLAGVTNRFFEWTLMQILAGGHDLRPDPAAGIDPHARHGSRARFVRDAADLFTAQPGRLH